MNAYQKRIEQDLKKIDKLSKQCEDKVRLIKTEGNPARKIEVELLYRTVPSRLYPSKVQEKTRVIFELSNRYPFNEPLATITTPIYHPNVYPSGKICFGTKWLPSQGLDLLVQRVIQIVIFDPKILNVESPANSEALSWYENSIYNNPLIFPTDQLLLLKEKKEKKISWLNIENRAR